MKECPFCAVCEICIIFFVEISTGLCFNLTVLHTNDIHGRFEETDQNGFTCVHNDACFGGVARMATIIREVRKKEGNVILLDGADRFSGTIWSEIYKGNATRIFFSELNYTAITLGNHDFDYGLQTLLRFLEQINCPVVVSNMNTSKEPLWPVSEPDLVRNTVIVNVNGEKIGFVGYIIPETSRTSNPGKNINFLPIINSVQNAVKKLESVGINKIIAVGHAGFDVDKEIAKKVIGVDIVVGGHSNTFLYSGTPPSKDKPRGPYPFIVHPDHNMNLGVLVVQAYYYTKYLGNLQVMFNAAGEVTSWSGNPVLLDSKVAKDPHVSSIVKKMKVLVDKKGNEKIGQVKVKLDATNCASRPCFLGELVALAMVYHYRSYNASISLFPGSGIRNSLPTDSQGDILYKDLFNSFPYRNTVDMVELSGADLKNSIEASGFLHVQGLRVKYSSSKVRRVENVQVKDVHCSTSNCYAPINLTETYKVVSHSYFITVSNRVMVTKARNRVRGDAIINVLVDYFEVKYPIKNNDVNIASKVTDCFVIFLLVILAWMTNQY